MKNLHLCCIVALLAFANGNVLRKARDVDGQEPELSEDCSDIDGNPISGKPYPYPGDCHRFYQCSNGYRTYQYCPDGTLFNPALSVCDTPENVPGCDGATNPPPTIDGDGDSDDNVFEACEHHGTKTLQCPDDSVIKVINAFYGRLSETVCYPNTDEVNCSAEGSQKIIEDLCNGQQSCEINPSNSVFGDPCYGTQKYVEVTYQCVADACVDSDGNPTSGAPYEIPGDCSGFYQCTNGRRTQQDCAEGTVFNPALGVCDWPQNVPGCGGDAPTTTEAPATQKPFDDDCVDDAGNPISGLPFQIPNDCSGFYQCSNGYKSQQDCPEETVFNPALSVCDWPQNVPGCGGDAPAPTNPPATEAPATQKPFDDDCVDDAGKPISGAPFQIPNDCSGFYQCSNGYKSQQDCAEGTVFNPALGVCDWPYNVPGCGGDAPAPTDPPATEAPATQKPFDDDCVDDQGNPISGLPFQIPGDCSGFYQCSNGYKYQQDCAEGTVFNPALSVCDWPQNVPGCGGDASAPTNPPATQKPFDDSCVDGEGKPISGLPSQIVGDCSGFYQCSNGYRTQQQCPEGTVFNPALSVCDWPQNVPGCGGDAPAPTNPPTQKPFDDDCVDENGNPISGKPFKIPNDCSGFYQCSNGYKSQQDCAEGTVFNPALSVCDWPRNVPECDGAAPPPTNPPSPDYDPKCQDAQGGPLSTPPFEKPNDCNNFYQCGAGILYTMPCAPGTVFNPKISVCDWSYNVPGC